MAKTLRVVWRDKKGKTHVQYMSEKSLSSFKKYRKNEISQISSISESKTVKITEAKPKAPKSRSSSRSRPRHSQTSLTFSSAEPTRYEATTSTRETIRPSQQKPSQTPQSQQQYDISLTQADREKIERRAEQLTLQWLDLPYQSFSEIKDPQLKQRVLEAHYSKGGYGTLAKKAIESKDPKKLGTFLTFKERKTLEQARKVEAQTGIAFTSEGKVGEIRDQPVTKTTTVKSGNVELTRYETAGGEVYYYNPVEGSIQYAGQAGKFEFSPQGTLQVIYGEKVVGGQSVEGGYEKLTTESGKTYWYSPSEGMIYEQNPTIKRPTDIVGGYSSAEGYEVAITREGAQFFYKPGQQEKPFKVITPDKKVFEYNEQGKLERIRIPSYTGDISKFEQEQTIEQYANVLEKVRKSFNIPKLEIPKTQEVIIEYGPNEQISALRSTTGDIIHYGAEGKPIKAVIQGKTYVGEELKPAEWVYKEQMAEITMKNPLASTTETLVAFGETKVNPFFGGISGWIEEQTSAGQEVIQSSFYKLGDVVEGTPLIGEHLKNVARFSGETLGVAPKAVGYIGQGIVNIPRLALVAPGALAGPIETGLQTTGVISRKSKELPLETSGRVVSAEIGGIRDFFGELGKEVTTSFERKEYGRTLATAGVGLVMALEMGGVRVTPLGPGKLVKASEVSRASAVEAGAKAPKTPKGAPKAKVVSVFDVFKPITKRLPRLENRYDVQLKTRAGGDLLVVDKSKALVVGTNRELFRIPYKKIEAFIGKETTYSEVVQAQKTPKGESLRVDTLSIRPFEERRYLKTPFGEFVTSEVIGRNYKQIRTVMDYLNKRDRIVGVSKNLGTGQAVSFVVKKASRKVSPFTAVDVMSGRYVKGLIGKEFIAEGKVREIPATTMELQPLKGVYDVFVSKPELSLIRETVLRRGEVGKGSRPTGELRFTELANPFETRSALFSFDIIGGKLKPTKPTYAYGKDITLPGMAEAPPVELRKTLFTFTQPKPPKAPWQATVVPKFWAEPVAVSYPTATRAGEITYLTFLRRPQEPSIRALEKISGLKQELPGGLQRLHIKDITYIPDLSFPDYFRIYFDKGRRGIEFLKTKKPPKGKGSEETLKPGPSIGPEDTITIPKDLTSISSKLKESLGRKPRQFEKLEGAVETPAGRQLQLTKVVKKTKESLTETQKTSQKERTLQETVQLERQRQKAPLGSVAEMLETKKSFKEIMEEMRKGTERTGGEKFLPNIRDRFKIYRPVVEPKVDIGPRTKEVPQPKGISRPRIFEAFRGGKEGERIRTPTQFEAPAISTTVSKQVPQPFKDLVPQNVPSPTPQRLPTPDRIPAPRFGDIPGTPVQPGARFMPGGLGGGPSQGGGRILGKVPTPRDFTTIKSNLINRVRRDLLREGPLASELQNLRLGGKSESKAKKK